MPINIQDLIAKASRPASVVLSEHAQEIRELMAAGISHKQILEILNQEYGIKIRLSYFRELIQGWAKGAKPRHLRSLEKYGDSLQKISAQATRTPAPKVESRPLLRREVASVTGPDVVETKKPVDIDLKPTPAPDTSEQSINLFNRASQSKSTGASLRKYLSKRTESIKAKESN